MTGTVTTDRIVGEIPSDLLPARAGQECFGEAGLAILLKIAGQPNAMDSGRPSVTRISTSASRTCCPLSASRRITPRAKAQENRHALVTSPPGGLVADADAALNCCDILNVEFMLKDKAHVIFKHRHLIAKRREDTMTSQSQSTRY